MSKIKHFSYCQSGIEGNSPCKRQCSHCTVYYKPIERVRLPRKLKKKLYKHAFEVFGHKMYEWLNTPILALNYQKPILHLKIPSGYKEINNILYRIEYGVYS